MKTTSCFGSMLAVIVGAMLLVSTAQAIPTLPSPAVTFTDTFSSTPVSVPETVGWTFTVLNPITVGALGVFDSSSAFGQPAGNNGLIDSHNVGIWNSGGTLLTSGTVAAGTIDPLINQFRYISIAPLLLAPGTYTIGATWGTTASDDYIANTTGFQTIAAIQFLSAEYVQAASLTMPTTNASFFSNGMFGPNFVVVPEPSTMLLLGAGFLGLAVYSKRRLNCAISK